MVGHGRGRRTRPRVRHRQQGLAVKARAGGRSYRRDSAREQREVDFEYNPGRRYWFARWTIVIVLSFSDWTRDSWRPWDVPAIVSDDALALQRLYDWEVSAPDRVVLTQPVGGGEVLDYSWRDVLDQ